MIVLIAGRELMERLRSKLFLGINAFLLVVIVGAVVLSNVVGADDTATIAVAGEGSAEVVRLAEASGLDVDAVPLPDRAAVEAAVLDGEVDAGVLDGAVLVVRSGVGQALEAGLAGAAEAARLDAALAEAGVPPAERAGLLSEPALRVERLEDDAEPFFGPAAMVTLVAVGILYGLLAFNGQWVAQGITEEKQSRVIELLLSSVRPSQLLAGKILGLGALGFGQVLVLSGAGLIALRLAGDLELPPEALQAIAVAVGWYVLGYGLYAALFAISGAVAARAEDLQSTTIVPLGLLVGSLFAAQAATASPGSTFAEVTAYLPFTAPMVQPVRVAAGLASPLEMLLAVAVAVVAIALLVPLAGRIYRGAALETGARVKLRSAWRSAG